jgi:putative acetyltransferase
MIEIREISPSDNTAIAKIIRDTLMEWGAAHPGTVYYDATTDHLFELFRTPKSIYYIALMDQTMVGGVGIFPTEGLPADTCELVKMYLLPQARGMGLGKTMIEKAISFAQQQGFKKIYLESMPELEKALVVYERMGFQYLNAPMGNTGHTGCSKWMLKSIDESHP